NAVLTTASTRDVGVLAGHLDAVFDAQFSPDGRVLATGSGDKTVRFWNPSTHRELGAPLSAADEVRRVAFCPDGRVLATAGGSAIQLWDIARRRSLGPLPTAGT